MYLGMDGTGIPMRSQEVVDRAGKQADSSAKTREAKLVTIWTAESRDEEGKPVRDPGSITYSAAIESAATRDTGPDLSDFAARVQREASRRGFPEAPRQAVLGDGSTWIWNTTAELCPRATQILDRFHAKEHLSQAGKVIYGDSLEVKSWIRTRYDEIDKGYLKSLVHALRRPPARAGVPITTLQPASTTPVEVQKPCLWNSGYRMRRALERKGCQCHYRPALPQAQRTL